MSRRNNLLKFQEFRKDFPVFIYDSFHYEYTGETLELSFSFSLPEKHHFSPKIIIPYKRNIFREYDTLSPHALQSLVFNIGMIEMISYWKAACPPQVIIKPFRLDKAAVAFWKKTYFQGLGEFFYQNSIHTSEDDFMALHFTSGQSLQVFDAGMGKNCLVPVGGGKDSVVTMELLNESKLDWLPMVTNSTAATRAVIREAAKKENETIDIFREIDPHLLEMNDTGFLNGHTPFSALLAFYSLLAAYLSGRKDIILSNESSANEATVPGTTINHQYSKSLEFEKDFRNYYHSFISSGFNYFSLLRPLSEFQIAGLFAKMMPYHSVFRSCNVGSKTGTWCGHCPKCLFTFIILTPFLTPDELIAIFGHNLLDDPSLEETFLQLTGHAEIKPFECIGTIDEVNQALLLAREKYAGEKTPYLLDLHYRRSSDPGPQAVARHFDDHHFVPENYLTIIKRYLHDQLT